MLTFGFVFVGWVFGSSVSVSFQSVLAVCCLFQWPAQLVYSWGMLAVLEAGGRKARGRWFVGSTGDADSGEVRLQLMFCFSAGVSLRIQSGGTERVEKVHGQPTWSSMYFS